MNWSDFNTVDYCLMGALALLFVVQVCIYAICLAAPARAIRGKKKHLHIDAPSTDELPGVSVVLCAHNESENLANYLQSLLTQDYPTYEVIVVDDGSEDDTREIVERYMVHDERLHPGVTGEVQCGDLRSCGGLRRSRVDATVLQIVTHARRGPVCPDGEDIGLAGRECPTALQRLVRATAGTAQTVKVGSAVSSSACHNLEVILRECTSVACGPVGETVVKRGVRDHVIACNHENAVLRRNLIASLGDDVLSRGKHRNSPQEKQQ